MTMSSTDDRRRRYHHLLGTIDKQTGHGGPIMIQGGPLWSTINYTEIEHTDAVRAMQAAIENDHVRRWVDAEGHNRYGVTDGGIDAHPTIERPTYTSEDVAGLREVVEVEAGRDDPEKAVIAWANRRLSEVER
jgi:hypothetical protein